MLSYAFLVYIFISFLPHFYADFISFYADIRFFLTLLKLRRSRHFFCHHLHIFPKTRNRGLILGGERGGGGGGADPRTPISENVAKMAFAKKMTILLIFWVSKKGTFSGRKSLVFSILVPLKSCNFSITFLSFWPISFDQEHAEKGPPKSTCFFAFLGGSKKHGFE